MKARIIRDQKRRQMVARHDKMRTALKGIRKDKSLSLLVRQMAQDKLAKMPRDSSAVRLSNRCQITGRPRSVSRFSGLSRIKFRELASAGKLPGITKVSW